MWEKSVVLHFALHARLIIIYNTILTISLRRLFLQFAVIVENLS